MAFNYWGSTSNISMGAKAAAAKLLKKTREALSGYKPAEPSPAAKKWVESHNPGSKTPAPAPAPVPTGNAAKPLVLPKTKSVPYNAPKGAVDLRSTGTKVASKVGAAKQKAASLLRKGAVKTINAAQKTGSAVQSASSKTVSAAKTAGSKTASVAKSAGSKVATKAPAAKQQAASLLRKGINAAKSAGKSVSNYMHKSPLTGKTAKTFTNAKATASKALTKVAPAAKAAASKAKTVAKVATKGGLRSTAAHLLKGGAYGLGIPITAAAIGASFIASAGAKASKAGEQAGGSQKNWDQMLAYAKGKADKVRASGKPATKPLSKNNPFALSSSGTKGSTGSGLNTGTGKAAAAAAVRKQYHATVWNPTTGVKKGVEKGYKFAAGEKLWTGGKATVPQAKAAIVRKNAVNWTPDLTKTAPALTAAQEASKQQTLAHWRKQAAAK